MDPVQESEHEAQEGDLRDHMSGDMYGSVSGAGLIANAEDDL